MNAKERYLFDLQGFLLIPGVLSRPTLDVMNAAIDQGPEKELPFRNGILEWGSEYRALIADPAIQPYLTAILGKHYRLDHEYAIIHKKGAKGLDLHGGNTPYDPGQYYHVRDGRIYSGLTVVSYALTDIGPDDGGFCCIPGSHKANFPVPEEFERHDDMGPTIHVPQRAGDVLIFTEALTHGTFPWQGSHERRSLLLKFSPSMIAWAEHHRSEEFLATLNDEERKILDSPRSPDRYEDDRYEP